MCDRHDRVTWSHLRGCGYYGYCFDPRRCDRVAQPLDKATQTPYNI